MLDVAAKFLVTEFNSYLLARTGAQFGKAELGRIVEDTGKWAIPDDQIGVSLINLEEDRILKQQLPESIQFAGRNLMREPVLRLSLVLLFAAKFQVYAQSLRFLSLLMTFFQSHSHFEGDRFPSLDPAIERITVELLSVSPEQLNQIWAYLGAKYLPSAIYRVRMVLLQDVAPIGVSTPIVEIDERLGVR